MERPNNPSKRVENEEKIKEKIITQSSLAKPSSRNPGQGQGQARELSLTGIPGHPHLKRELHSQQGSDGRE